MKVVNLMAGLSSRLRPLTDDRHKVLLKLGKKSLLEHQLEAFREVGIHEAVFVVGHRADLIKSKVGSNYGGIEIQYVDNPHHQTRNINYSLYLAREKVEGKSFIYMEADLFFHSAILGTILSSPFGNCLVADRRMPSKMVDTLVLGGGNRVTGLLFQDHGDLARAAQTGKGIVGELVLIIKFDAASSSFLFDELERSDFEGATTLYSIFDQCCQNNEMHYFLVDGYPWVEIDTHEDLRRAREIERRGIGQCYHD